MKRKIVALPQLPKKITVRYKIGKSGCLIAEIPKYNLFTEADNREHLDMQINDLIYTFFDVPRKLQGKIRYIPPWDRKDKIVWKSKITSNIKLNAFYSPSLFA